MIQINIFFVRNRLVKDASGYLRYEQFNPPCSVIYIKGEVLYYYYFIFFIYDVYVDWNVPCI